MIADGSKKQTNKKIVHKFPSIDKLSLLFFLVVVVVLMFAYIIHMLIKFQSFFICKNSFYRYSNYKNKLHKGFIFVKLVMLLDSMLTTLRLLK